MGIWKRRVAQVLTLALVVSSLAPSGMTVSASVIEGNMGGQERAERLQEEQIASGSDASEDLGKRELPGEDIGGDGVGKSQNDEEVEIREGTEQISEIEKSAEASGTCGENLTWSLVDGVLTISGTGEMASYDDPQNYGATLVPWNESKAEIIEIIVENGVTSIGGYAFGGCGGLTSITIPEGVTTIGSSAFHGCSGLTDVYYKGSESGWSAISIGESNEPLTNATIHYNSTGPNLDGLSGTCGKNLTWILIDGILTISGTGDMASYEVTSDLSLMPPWNDRSQEIKEIRILSGVTSIGNVAFINCNNVESVSIADTVTTIGNNAFAGCSSLPNITIPNSVTIIENAAFSGCDLLNNVTIPDSVTTIGSYAFSYCSGLASITLPNSLTQLGEFTFWDSGLKDITIPGSLASTGNYTFKDCTQLTNVAISDGITSIGESAFSNCSALTNITIPGSVTAIGEFAFFQCTSLASINIPYGVTTIGSSTFGECTGLINVTIPDSVTTIGLGAFGYCINLEDVTIPGSVTTMENSVFSGCSKLTYMAIPDSVTSLGDYFFNECVQLSSVTIPKSITSIGAEAFDGCTALADVYYGGNENDWGNILRGEKNEPLDSATIHYNSTGPDPSKVTINLSNLGDAVLYVPYSGTLKLNGSINAYSPLFRIANGTLPQGLELNSETGEIYGVPRESGNFEITVEVVLRGAEDITHQANLTITIKENTDDNIYESCDEGYELEQYIGEKTDHGYVLKEYSDQLLVSAGKFEQFVALWLNGEKLVEGEDYTAESGSTRITVRKQTFENKTKPGSNTLSAEFRNEDGDLKRTSQNFTIEEDKPDDKPNTDNKPGTDTKPGTGGTGSIGGGGTGGSGSGSSSSSGSSGSGSGSSGSSSSGSGSKSSSSGGRALPYTNDSWVKDDIGWRCKKPDNTWLTNGWYLLPYNGTTGWYYFNQEGYMATGWIMDQGRWYYLNPVSDGTQGIMLAGWRLINEKWYYLNEQADGTQGALMVNTQIGEYRVDENGVWVE